MKAIVALAIIVFAGLNLYQYVRNSDLQTELELQKTTAEGKLENAKASLREDNAKLVARNASLEKRIESLEKEIASAAAKTAPPQEKPEPATGPDGNEGEAPMAALSEMMKNPQMKEMMVAQQKATLETMYKGLFAKLGLEGDDLEHFKKLLTDGQMEMMEAGMSLMDPNLTDEDRQAIYAKIAKGQEDMKANVKEFLNDEEDFQEYEFYSSTLNERMTVTGLQAELQAQNMGLDPTREEQLIGIMYEERSKIPFENQYYDQTKFDPTTITDASVDRYMEQYGEYQTNLGNRVGEILTPEQTAVFNRQQEQAINMQKFGLKMAAGMFGSGDK